MVEELHTWWNSILKNSTCDGILFLRTPHVVGGVHTWWQESTLKDDAPVILSHNRRLFRQQLGFTKSFFAGCANLDGSLET